MRGTGSGGSGDKGNMEKIGEGVGGIAGRAADTAMGWMGSMLGSATSALGEWWSGDEARNASRAFDSRDRECRRHFEGSFHSAGTNSYEDARPLYQFGHTARSNPKYRSRSFEDVEPELRTAWGDEQRDRFGDWQDVRGYVGFGYGEGPLD